MDNNFVDLGIFLRNNFRLEYLRLQNVDIGGIERSQYLTLGSLSIKWLHFEGNNLDDAGFAVIAAAMSKQTQLQRLVIRSNSIGAPSFKTLGAMTSAFPRLDHLNISNNNIDDTGLKALIGGLASNRSLVELNLSGNRLITAEGLRTLSSLFHSESCKLEDLKLEDMNIGDDGAEALADALVGNKSLKHVCLNTNAIYSAGWSAFSRLLCDPSSINNTYLSNRTLESIGNDPYTYYQSDRDVRKYLGWNRDKSHRSLPSQSRCNRPVPKPQMRKILYIHRDLDLEPFFQYKLKFLPIVVGWLQSSATYLADNENPNIECRQLAAMYKFIRSKPQLVFDGYWAHTLKETREKKRKLLLQLDTLNETEKNALKRVRR